MPNTYPQHKHTSEINPSGKNIATVINPSGKKIKQAVRREVWYKHNGTLGEVNCPVCFRTKITPFSFECGYIKAKACGGSNAIPNIMPICGPCNKSMGTDNLHMFIKKHWFNRSDEYNNLVKKNSRSNKLKDINTLKGINNDLLNDLIKETQTSKQLRHRLAEYGNHIGNLISDHKKLTDENHRLHAENKRVLDEIFQSYNWMWYMCIVGVTALSGWALNYY